MKILIYNPFAGISGDMNIGAMVSLGVPESYFDETIKHLHLHGVEIEFAKDQRKGISGVKVLIRDKELLTADNGSGFQHEHEHKHKHEHEHGSKKQKSQNINPHPHRNLEDIKKIIQESSLSDPIKERSLAIFTNLAEAEARVHGTSISEVHFHEAGAVDSIADIVCAASAIEFLKPDKIISLPVELGSGFVNCAHGILPVPAPAVAALLENIPVTYGRINHEATTPTGAAILKTVVDEFQTEYSYRIIKTGYGLGSRDVEIPNILRIMFAEPFDSNNSADDNFSNRPDDDAVMMNCNIDDMNPEFYSNVMNKLFNAGAKEVYLTPVYMKKNRPGTLLSVMTTLKLEEIMTDIIFLETTTAGIRSYNVKQKMLERKEGVFESKYGKLRVKKLFYKGNCISKKPEYDDMVRLADENKISIKELYKEVKL